MKYRVVEFECYIYDGCYTVNDAWFTGETVEIAPDSTDKEIIKVLKNAGLIKPGIHSKSIQVEGELEYSLYINDIRRSAGYYMPVYELRPV